MNYVITLRGRFFFKNVNKSYLNSSRNRLLAAILVKDLVVVDTDNVTLKSDTKNIQEVKKFCRSD
tara:strand:- start:1394 stop:1588 length:195 start_codon:yes stop_codon:yes gene_type:complete